MSDQELMALREAAAEYKVPVATLRTAVQRGYIPARKIGNLRVVERGAVEAYVRNRPRRGRPVKDEGRQPS